MAVNEDPKEGRATKGQVLLSRHMGFMRMKINIVRVKLLRCGDLSSTVARVTGIVL